jgi:hypothetical protein
VASTDPIASAAEERRDSHHTRRLSRRLLVGACIGFGACALIGLVVGLIVYRPWSTVMWVTVIGAGFFGAAVGALTGGMSALESPDPGEEPSQFAHPVSDPDGLTRTERDSNSDAGAAAEDAPRDHQ